MHLNDPHITVSPPDCGGIVMSQDQKGFGNVHGNDTRVGVYVQGYGQDQGFWLVHSVPSFPAAPRKAPYSGMYGGPSLLANQFRRVPHKNPCIVFACVVE